MLTSVGRMSGDSGGLLGRGGTSSFLGRHLSWMLLDGLDGKSSNGSEGLNDFQIS